MLSENADVFSVEGNLAIVRQIPNFDDVKDEILQYLQTDHAKGVEVPATAMKYTDHINCSQGQWAIDPGRIASLACYAPSYIVEELGNRFGSIPGTSCDVSPDYNFFGMHGIDNDGDTYKTGKAQTLILLQRTGRNARIIGNSNSDFVDPNTGVETYFVGGTDLTASGKYQRMATYISDKPYISGINDIINHLEQTHS
jgi:hypothetical protein